MVRAVLSSMAAVMAVALPAASAASLPKVLTQETPMFQLRPGVISYTGDGTGYIGGPDGTSVRHLGRLRWTVSNRREGEAVGLVWLNDCTPDCAHGHFSPTPVRVRASSPAHGHFRLLTLRYSYRGRRYVDRRVARFYRGGAGLPSYWEYAICGVAYAPRC